MTTVSSTVPSCSDCSRSSTPSRSDWFRRSVLFWSSQSERSDECTNDRRCRWHSHGLESPTSSVISNFSPLSERKKSPRKTSRSKSTPIPPSVPPKPPRTTTPSSLKTAINPLFNIEPEPVKKDFDPTDLLKQVEELERCFDKRLDLEEECSVASPVSAGEASSPHLTLKFPVGSTIKQSPLFSSGSKTTSPVIMDDLNAIEEITDCPNVDTNNEHENTENVIESIQKVQDCLSEISRELELSSRNSHQNATEELKTIEDVNYSVPDEKLTSKNISNVKKNEESNVPVEQDESIRDERDPNAVMMDWLSNIKPPPPPSEHPAEKCSRPRRKTKPVDNEHVINTDELLQKIDALIRDDDGVEDVSQMNASNQQQLHRDRYDSGLQSTSSDSNSPYPSPSVTRALDSAESTVQRCHSHSNEFVRTQGVIPEVTHEKLDSVFKDDSDFSDWSPISTLEAVRGTSSVVNSHREKLQPNTELTSSTNADSEICTAEVQTKSFEQICSQKEEETARKLLALSREHRESGTKLDQLSLDNLAMLPSIKNAIEEQRRELAEQRQKQQEFLHQLGDLLLEIVNLKEENKTVRTKQTKALNILKKQLDNHKKTQSQAHTDVINKVNNLDEKMSSTLNYTTAEPGPSPSPLFYADRERTFSFGIGDSNSSSLQHKGHIIWKIPDVMKKLNRIKCGSLDGTLTSPAFLTSEYGYKMNAWLYLNGRGKMVGKYVSLYVCVLVGEYDPILNWPIQPAYSLTLLDQQSDSTQRQDFVKIRRVVDIAGRGGNNVIAQHGGVPRPNDSTKALIIGFDDFISHEELLSRKYLADDVIFLKIEAQVS